MSQPEYDGLTLNVTTMGTVTDRFGSAATTANLSRAFGPNWLQKFIQYEPVGESCVWYLNTHDGADRAFQLCFNNANVLVDKQVITP